MSIINNWRLWLRQNKGITKPINNEPDIDKIYIYVKDLYETKYQFLTKKRESTGFTYVNDSKAFI